MFSIGYARPATPNRCAPSMCSVPLRFLLALNSLPIWDYRYDLPCLLYSVLGIELRASLAPWCCCVFVRAGGRKLEGWRCRLKSILGDSVGGSKICGRRIWMRSGVLCIAGCVVNHSDGACCCRGAVGQSGTHALPSPSLSVVVTTCSPSTREVNTGGS